MTKTKVLVNPIECPNGGVSTTIKQGLINIKNVSEVTIGKYTLSITLNNGEMLFLNVNEDFQLELHHYNTK